jgi:Zn-dependent M28 family amino/carboxypeptidase
VTVEGTDLKDEQFAIGAHFDSTEFSYGAWDNGAGVVQVIEVLRHLSQNPPRRTIHAIFFGSEEVGLKGSRAFLENHKDLQDNLLAIVNIDVGGSYLGNDMVVLTAHDEALHYVQGLLKEAGHSAKSHTGAMSSDSIVFSDYGIPAVFFGRMATRGGGYMHTRFDTIDLISADVLEEEIRFLIFFIDRISSSEIFPIYRFIPENLRKKIVEYFGTGLSHMETITEFPEEPEQEKAPF